MACTGLRLEESKKAIDNEKALKKIKEIAFKHQQEKTIKITEEDYKEIMGVTK